MAKNGTEYLHDEGQIGQSTLGRRKVLAADKAERAGSCGTDLLVGMVKGRQQRTPDCAAFQRWVSTEYQGRVSKDYQGGVKGGVSTEYQSGSDQSP